MILNNGPRVKNQQVQIRRFTNGQDYGFSFISTFTLSILFLLISNGMNVKSPLTISSLTCGNSPAISSISPASESLSPLISSKVLGGNPTAWQTSLIIVLPSKI